MPTHPTAAGTRLDADAPLFSIKPFRLLLTVRVLSTLGIQMLLVAIGWQMYALTHDAWALALVGLYQFLPVLLLTPPAGYAADHWPRTRIVSIALTVQTVVAGVLALGTYRHGVTRDALLAVSCLLGAARAFQLPALQALAPATVPVAQLSRGMAVLSMGTQTSIIVGPALGGLLAVFGLGFVYAVAAGALFVGLIMSARLRPLHQTVVKKGPLLDALVGGLRFVWQQPIVLAAISLDLFAVLFGGATALLPIYASDILHGGPATLGWLRAAPAVGALAMSLLLSRRPPSRRVGVTLLTSVACFGLSTIVFGLSVNFWLSEIALVVSGAADAVSVVIRQTLVQLETPDEMRGRVSAVNAVFIGASNQLGEFESGAAASWLGPVVAVVSGGLLTCVVALLWAWRFPQLAKRASLEG